MNIVVLAGSPKGNASVTLQSVRWLERRYPEHEFVVHRVAQRIKRLENDPAAFRAVLDDVGSADLVLWAFPVYYFLVHAHLKRFIELAFERGAGAFRGRPAAAISTSIKVMDHTAHAYVRAVSDDLGGRWLGSYSAHMRDLLDPVERTRLEGFFQQLVDDVARGAPGAPAIPPLPASSFVYEVGARRIAEPVDVEEREVLVVTDVRWEDAGLRHMVRRLRRAFRFPIRVVNLHDVDIVASCQGCLRCGWDNTCAFEGHDGFVPFFRERVETADILVFAGAVRDRFLSARWKSFFDRQFFENHRPVLEGVKLGVLVSGPLDRLPHLREVLEAYAELHHAELVGWVCDEGHDSPTLDAQIDDLAIRLARAARTAYTSPRDFRGVGAETLFRDAVFGWLRFPFLADHRSYREAGRYDFPQKDRRTRATNAVLASLSRVPRIRARMYGQLRQHMVARHEAVVEAAEPVAEAAGPVSAAGPVRAGPGG